MPSNIFLRRTTKSSSSTTLWFLFLLKDNATIACSTKISLPCNRLLQTIIKYFKRGWTMQSVIFYLTQIRLTFVSIFVNIAYNCCTQRIPPPLLLLQHFLLACQYIDILLRMVEFDIIRQVQGLRRLWHIRRYYWQWNPSIIEIVNALINMYRAPCLPKVVGDFIYSLSSLTLHLWFLHNTTYNM